VENDGAHYFLIDAKSEKGENILESFALKVSLKDASTDEVGIADDLIEKNAISQQRSLNKEGMKGLLQANATSAQWDEIASRCLSCANCTLVCPTCFCSTVEDITDLTGDHSERWRKWESCFTYEFSTVHTKPVRSTITAKYRQWMTHKLDTWYDQFDSSGCIGCGRCITWCPTGIDITAEARKMELGRASV
jgi:ferredoxin